MIKSEHQIHELQLEFEECVESLTRATELLRLGPEKVHLQRAVRELKLKLEQLDRRIADLLSKDLRE
jgi:hypothetical protein